MEKKMDIERRVYSAEEIQEILVILLAWNVYMGKCGAYNLSAVSSTEYGAMTAVIAAMAFWRHRANIIRLIHGNENKVGAKKS